MAPASPRNGAHIGRRGSPSVQALLVGALCLLVGGLIGRQTQERAPWLPAGAGSHTARRSLRGNTRNGVGSLWPQAALVEPARPSPKSHYLPAELGVHHYSVLGKLHDGASVALHLWLVMMRQPGADGGNGTITMQGYGTFQTVDVITVNAGGMLAMPPVVEETLQEEGFLFLEQRATGGQFNISTRLNARSTRSPFHLRCLLPGDVAPPGVALDLHVRGWRRFLALPVDLMLAVTPDTARGRFRVGVFLSPEMTGPQAARLVALHAQHHVGVLGFHEEQVYMHPNQLADCLRDPEILEMVQNAQLKLVLNDSFPELFTFCLRLNGSVTASEKVAHAGGVNSSISAGEKSCTERMEDYGNQLLVNAHIMLANVGSDAYVLNVDVDEYLVSDNSTTLEELFDGCFGNQTAFVPRLHALCTECEERNVTDMEVWMDRRRGQHPLAQYQTLIPRTPSGSPQPKCLVKPDEVWSVDVHGVHVLEGHGRARYEDVLACGARLVHVVSMYRKRCWRAPAHSDSEFECLWPLQ